MRVNNYRTAGQLLIVMAILTLPLLTLAVFSGLLAKTHPELQTISVILEIAISIIGVYVFLATKHLLNNFANYYALDRIINILIFLTIASIALPLFRLFNLWSPSLRLAIDIGFIFIIGVIQLIFGLKLLKCDNNLFGHKKILSYLSIIAGGLAVTVILSPMAMLVGIAMDIYLAKIFFDAYNKKSQSTINVN